MTETLKNLPTLLLATEHYDPSMKTAVAKINLPTKATPYSDPERGDCCLLRGDGGAQVIELEVEIDRNEEQKNAYWTFSRVADGKAGAHASSRLCPAYKKPLPIAEAPKLPMGENQEPEAGE